MKQVFIVKEGNPTLLLFFAGWGADESPFKDDCPPEMDYMICYDYRNMDFDASLLNNYTSMHIAGWSMGVWAAMYTFGKLYQEQVKLPACLSSTAINGTPFPVDDEYGIPKEIYHGTINGLSGASLNKFLRRMCGSAKAYKEFLAVTPHRPLEELCEELIAIEQTAAHPNRYGIAWDVAVIGEDDRIIPAVNQQRAWAKVKKETPQLSGTYKVLPNTPHYRKELLSPSSFLCRSLRQPLA
ncbi:MAG: DUF452 family protein [Prevotellaceae bacterium]|jgi:biotin synthesis protein BioG|nr:DUF452 family protein [Prevotellaceae bacterium]